MIDKLIKLIEKSANDHVDGTCSAVSAHFCRSTDCSECVFNDQKVGVLLSELKELRDVKHREDRRRVVLNKRTNIVADNTMYVQCVCGRKKMVAIYSPHTGWFLVGFPNKTYGFDLIDQIWALYDYGEHFDKEFDTWTKFHKECNKSDSEHRFSIVFDNDELGYAHERWSKLGKFVAEHIEQAEKENANAKIRLES